MKRLLTIAAGFLLVLSGCAAAISPTIVTFQAAPPTITAGQESILIWVVTGAQTATIEPGVGTVDLAGSTAVRPSQTTTYTITATGYGGTASSPLTVTVNPSGPAVNFTANPSTITAGDGTTLQWGVTGARSVLIEPGVGQVALTGSRMVYPSASTTYTLVAQGDAGPVSRTVVVIVNNPPIEASFTAFPETVTAGDQRSQLRWSVQGANRVRIVPDVGEVPAAGSYGIIPARTTTYVLTAETDCCVISRSVTVTVAGSTAPPQYGPVVELFNITPNSIYRGESATLEWRVANAASVTIEPGIGTVPPSGSVSVSPQASTTYTMTVSNAFAFYPVTARLLVFNR